MMVKELKVFWVEDSPYMEGQYVLRIRNNIFHANYTSGSYNVMAARLLGLSYGDYLRYCRDEYGATIIGRNSTYPVAYFSDQKQALKLSQKLNKLASLVMWNLEVENGEQKTEEDEHCGSAKI